MTTVGKYKAVVRPTSRPPHAYYNTNNNFGRDHENPFEIDLSFRPVDFTAFGKCKYWPSVCGAVSVWFNSTFVGLTKPLLKDLHTFQCHIDILLR